MSNIRGFNSRCHTAGLAAWGQFVTKLLARDIHRAASATALRVQWAMSARDVLVARWPYPLALKCAFCGETGFLRGRRGSCLIVTASLQHVSAFRILSLAGSGLSSPARLAPGSRQMFANPKRTSRSHCPVRVALVIFLHAVDAERCLSG